MAEDHEVAQQALIAHGAEPQQRTQGFSRAWACKHQKVAAAALTLEPAPKQLDQLLLPLPGLDLSRLNLVRVLSGREVEADG